MKKMIVLLFLGLFFQAFYANSQCPLSYNINQLDSNGVRNGFWIEKNEQQIIFKHYQNGVLNGTYWITSVYGNHLITIGEFKNGEYSGMWYNFDDDGKLLYIQSDFKKTFIQIPSIYNAKGFCTHQCYYISFYPNGCKKSEGLLLWNISPDSDFTYEYGKWKYYNETGILKYIKDYSDSPSQ